LAKVACLGWQGKEINLTAPTGAKRSYLTARSTTINHKLSAFPEDKA
jgi:hypothetical protein